MTDRVIPHDVDLEAGVLGAALTYPDLAIELVAALNENHFYVPVHKAIFSVMSDIVSNGETVDMVAVKHELAKVRDDVKPTVLLDIMDQRCIESALQSNIERMKDLEVSRRVIDIGTMVVAKAFDGSDGTRTLAEAIDSLMSVNGADDGKTRQLYAVCDERIQRATEPEEFFTVPGFEDIHLFGGDLFVIGGRPGAGKTAFAMQLAMHWADIDPVMFFSYEMTEQQLADRVLSSMSGLSVADIERGVSQEDADKMRDIVDKRIVNKNLSIRRAAGMTNAELFAEMYRFKAKGGKVVIIDYLQLAADKSKAGLTHDTTIFSNQLRRVALDTGLLVVAIAQLNRGGQDREAVKMPQVYDLRESGAIEQDATTIALLMAVPNPKFSPQGAEFLGKILSAKMDFRISDLDVGTGDYEDDKTAVTVDFAKVRQGKRSRWLYIFDGRVMTFTPVRRVVPHDYTNKKDFTEQMDLEIAIEVGRPKGGGY